MATKREDGKDFGAGDYAYVPDADTPSEWKLRLTNTPGGAPDAGIVGAAAAALGKGFRGQPVSIPESARGAVKAKVRAAWKQANPDKDPDEMPESIKASEPALADLRAAAAAFAEAKAFASRPGNVQQLIATFDDWAGGSQAQCADVLADKGFDDVDALCAWMKDKATGSTDWRGDDDKKKGAEAGQCKCQNCADAGDCADCDFCKGTPMTAAEPDGGDVHADKPLTNRPGKPSGITARKLRTPAFMHKLRELIVDHMRGGGALGEQDYAEMVGKARGHAIKIGRQLRDGDASATARTADEGDMTPPLGVDWDAGLGEDPAVEELEEGAPHFFKSDARVSYRKADTAGEMCASCRFFDSDDLSCRMVEGEIRPGDVCDLYDPAFLIAAAEDGPWPNRGPAVFNLAELAASRASESGAPTTRHGVRVFVEQPAELFSAAEPPDEFQYLPRPGTYHHPKWGQIAITRERNERFVQHHNEGVYQSEIPIDAEHETKLSGPMVYVGALRMNPDGSVNATRLRWTDRGRKMMEGDRFKYFSPEWYDEWPDPLDNTIVHHDIAIGGALTSRPYFKERSLRPLIAGEGGVSVCTDDPQIFTAGGDVVVHFEAMQADEPRTRGSEPAPKAPEAGAPQQHKEDGTMAVDPKAFAELQQKLAAEEAARTGLESQLKQATETIGVLASEARRKRFTETVLGTGGPGDGHPRWTGETDKHVAILEALAACEGGEESAEFKSYVEFQNANAAQLRQSGHFKEIGTSDGGGRAASGNSGYDELEAEVGRLLQAGEAKSVAEAWAKAYETKPKAAVEYTNALRKTSQDITPMDLERS